MISLDDHAQGTAEDDRIVASMFKPSRRDRLYRATEVAPSVETWLAFDSARVAAPSRSSQPSPSQIVTSNRTTSETLTLLQSDVERSSAGQGSRAVGGGAWGGAPSTPPSGFLSAMQLFKLVVTVGPMSPTSYRLEHDTTKKVASPLKPPTW